MDNLGGLLSLAGLLGRIGRNKEVVLGGFNQNTIMVPFWIERYIAFGRAFGAFCGVPASQGIPSLRPQYASIDHRSYRDPLEELTCESVSVQYTRDLEIRVRSLQFGRLIA